MEGHSTLKRQAGTAEYYQTLLKLAFVHCLLKFIMLQQYVLLECISLTYTMLRRHGILDIHIEQTQYMDNKYA